MNGNKTIVILLISVLLISGLGYMVFESKMANEELEQETAYYIKLIQDDNEWLQNQYKNEYFWNDMHNYNYLYSHPDMRYTLLSHRAHLKEFVDFIEINEKDLDYQITYDGKIVSTFELKTELNDRILFYDSFLNEIDNILETGRET